MKCDFHVHPICNSITDIVAAMDHTGTDVIAASALDGDYYPHMLYAARRAFPDIKYDSAGIRLPNGKFILNAREYNTFEGIHLLSVGTSFETRPISDMREIIDQALEDHALVMLDHPFVDNFDTRTAGHITDEMRYELERVCCEYLELAVEWNAYCRPDARAAIKLGSQAAKPLRGLFESAAQRLPGIAGSAATLAYNLTNANIDYFDVNREAEKLAKQHDLPMIPGTDLHARRRGDLKYIGHSHIIADAQGEMPAEMLRSLRNNIFEMQFEAVKRYVPLPHLFRSFMLPQAAPEYFWKPRA